jgi:TetR/AcrR family transcriptional repressor of mexJK operon
MQIKEGSVPARKRAGSSVVEVSRADVRTELLTDRLLKAATQVFMEKGYDAASMGEIAARAHASKETFYRHFPTKDELFRAVVISRAERVAEGLGTALLAHEPPEKALTAFGELVITQMVSNDSVTFHRVLGMARERFPDLLQLYRTTGPYRIRDAVALYLKQQTKAGKLRSMNAEIAARQFFDLVASEMIISANISGKTNPSKAAIRQRVREGLDCFLNGYGV